MRAALFTASVLLVLSLGSDRILAHCDALDGPVAVDARLALEKGDLTPVLKWIGPAQEAEIGDAFQVALEVRQGGHAAKAMADRYFLETLVRVHRAGEGEPFTGLKPAGKTDPGILAADKALQSASPMELGDHLSGAVKAAIQRRFEIASERRKHAGDSVEAGRAYVAAYVDYIHFVENVHRLVSEDAPHAHGHGAAAPAGH